MVLLVIAAAPPAVQTVRVSENGANAETALRAAPLPNRPMRQWLAMRRPWGRCSESATTWWCTRTARAARTGATQPPRASACTGRLLTSGTSRRVQNWRWVESSSVAVRVRQASALTPHSPAPSRRTTQGSSVSRTRRNVSERLRGRQTNNHAEIAAATRAIRIARAARIERLEIRTDSEFLVSCASLVARAACHTRTLNKLTWVRLCLCACYAIQYCILIRCRCHPLDEEMGAERVAQSRRREGAKPSRVGQTRTWTRLHQRAMGTWAPVQSQKFRIYDLYLRNLLRIVIILRNCALPTEQLH